MHVPQMEVASIARRFQLTVGAFVNDAGRDFEMSRSTISTFKCGRQAPDLCEADSMTEPLWDVICQNCGKVYSLHTRTVCPTCFTWPTWPQKELTKGEATENPQQNH